MLLTFLLLLESICIDIYKKFKFIVYAYKIQIHTYTNYIFLILVPTHHNPYIITPYAS